MTSASELEFLYTQWFCSIRKDFTHRGSEFFKGIYKTSLDKALPPNGKVLMRTLTLLTPLKGAQWLSGRVLDSRPRGSGFEPHRCH